MVFLQHNGVPALDMIFDGPYGVYHSVYDDFAWMARFGDPGFRYHAAMSRLWGLLALRFANADLLPLDYSIYATEVAAYLEGLEKIAPADFFTGTIRALIEKCHAWRDAAVKVSARLAAWRVGSVAAASPPPNEEIAHGDEDIAATVRINSALLSVERALLDDDGIPGRPWFRHLVYAPRPSYEAETLPGLREALEAGDLERARQQAERLRGALQRALDALSRVLQKEN
jgi:N-acetylated-alpha-linked acidic dipeptidase